MEQVFKKNDSGILQKNYIEFHHLDFSDGLFHNRIGIDENNATTLKVRAMNQKAETITKDAGTNRDSRYTLPGRMARMYIVVMMLLALIVTGLTTAIMQYETTRSRDDLIILLDPGHGGSDTGATNKSLGLYESSINLKIALACRDRLQQYKGVRVYMTHTGVNSTYGKSSLSSRVSMAGKVKADILISLHINDASSRSANGCEVFVPVTRHEPKFNEQCTQLAECIIERLTSLGLKSRGVKTRRSGGGRVYKFSDGTTEKGDYYYVIGETISRYEIPGILIEHGFIVGDADYMDSDSDLAALGIADADGIAKHYGLRLKQDASSGKDAREESGVTSRGMASVPDEAASDNEYTSEDDENSELGNMENLIRELPDSPGAGDAGRIAAVREAYNALSRSSRNQLSAELYQKMCNAVTAYENAVRPVRFTIKEGSQLSIDRFNGKLLHVGTATQLSGKVSVLSLTVELDLVVSPDAPEPYKTEGALTCRVTNAAGKELKQNDEVTEGSVISLQFNDTILDSLVISME